MEDVARAQVGDKIAVLGGEHTGSRGVIMDVRNDSIVVNLGEVQVELPVYSIQNFSAAARKAWRTRPERNVGRPKNLDLPRKRMVSLRLDERVWEDLGKAVERGIIRSREAAINQWLQEKLDELWGNLPTDTTTNSQVTHGEAINQNKEHNSN